MSSFAAYLVAAPVAVLGLVGCAADTTKGDNPTHDAGGGSGGAGGSGAGGSGDIPADVTAVAPAGDAGAYTLNVTVQSPDTGCDQYANWWEVVSEDEKLIYRRILDHSHVSEQPFTRSGGPVALAVDQTVIVRAYMHPTGYGGEALRGNVEGGFASVDLAADFGSGLATEPPLPDGCAY